MTNTSAKKTFAVLSMLAITTLISSGAFVSIAHAQDDGGYVDTAGDNSGYVDTSGDNGGYVDTYGDNGGYVDTSGDNGGYVDTSGDNGGYVDTSGDNGGYVDTSGDNGGYVDTSGDNGGYLDTGITCDTGCVEEGGTVYSQVSYPTESGTTYTSYTTPTTFSAPTSYTPSFSTPSFSMPSFTPSAPRFVSAPVVQNVPVAYQQPQYQQQQQQQQQQLPPQIVQQPAPAPVTNNTCTNYSCNTTTSFNNSGNTTTTVIPVAAAPVTYPVQYTFPQNYQNVSCTISTSQNAIQNGQYAYLNWQSYGAVSATLSNYGNVAPNGSLSVRPNGSSNYVLTVYGQNGQTATCNTNVTMANNYPSVTLSQIPYTGFDFGTFGDAMYWAMLMAFALSAGYLLVYYKGGMGVFAGAMIPARQNSRSTVATTRTVSHAAPSFAKASQGKPVVEQKIETPTPSPIRVATLESLPAFTNVRPTSDSMTIATGSGAPRIIISRS